MGLKKDEERMKDHLKDYILFQVNQGYEPQDIKNLLLRYGYKKNLVDEIFIEIGDYFPAKKHSKKGKQEISEDLSAYLKELLMDFIIREKEQGYPTSAIRKALINYGHRRELVDAAIEAVEGSKEKSPDPSQKKKKSSINKKKEGKAKKELDKIHQVLRRGVPPLMLYMIIIIILLGFCVFLSAATNTSIYIVVLSFTPVIIALTVNYFSVLNFKSDDHLNLVPFLMVFLTAFIFIGVLQIDTPLRDIAQPETVFLLNVIAAFIFSSVLCFFSRWPHIGEKIEPWDKMLETKKEEKTPIEKELDNGEKKLEKILGKEEGLNNEKS